MKGFVQYILSVAMTFLPPRYRSTDTRLRGPAMVAGILQAFGAMALLLLRFYFFSLERAGFIGNGVNVPSNLPEVNATPGGGIFMMADFVFNPLNAIFLYFFYEGLLVRFLAALVGHQVIGTLPLYAISGLHGLIDKKRYKAYVGRLVVDEVARGSEKQGYGLKVYSCRPKLDWNPYMTVEFEGEFYQYFKEEYGPGPRRFIYYLRKQPVGIPAAVIDHYKIDDVLKPEPDKWAGTPGLWDKMFSNWNQPPLVADEVVRGVGSRQDYDLKVYSCRPKRDWNTLVTIEFEEQWYQLFKDERGPKPRPYIYYLRKSAESRPAVVIRPYKIDDVLKQP